MAQASLAQPTANVDRDFVGTLAARNQATMEPARAELLYGHNDEIRRLAQNIVTQQQHEMSATKRAGGDAGVNQAVDVGRTAASNVGSPPGADR